jgi:hypothetical protein
MKVICLHHRLGGYTSHHFNEAHGFMLELDRRGKDFVLLVNRRAEPRIVKELNARPVCDDPTFLLQWSFEERSQRFLDMLHQRVDRLVKAGDWVMVTIATQLEAHALTRWIQELPQRKKPWIVVLFLSDRWNRSGREEYERQIAEFHKLRSAIAGLTPEAAHRMIFYTLTDLLAEELSELLGTRVGVAPMPLPYGVPNEVHNWNSSVPRVAILGGTRREKGSYLIPDIIRACRGLVQVEFLVHLTNNSLTAEESGQLARIADEPGVSVIEDALPLPEYEAALRSADLALFPYETIPYRKRTSGVFGEAVAFGKPVVVTPGTWLAEQIQAGRAAGTISDDLQPESIARAIADCVSNLDELRRSAQAVSAEWRKTVSLPAFVDLMESEIARRALSRIDEKPAPRRSWWPFSK